MAEPFPVTIEGAWHALMKQLGKKNIGHANDQVAAAKGILRIMARK